MNIHPPIAYLISVLMLLFAATSIKRSRIIDFFGEKILKDSNEKSATLMLIALSYILSPLFLSFVLVSSFDKWILRFNNKKKTLTFLLASTLLGSSILPFGNLRNTYITIFLGDGKPGISISSFASIMLPLWIIGLVILLVMAYRLCEEKEIKEKKTKTKWRWKELLFAFILFIFIIAYFNKKLNLLGFFFLAGAFSFAFIGIDTLKQVDWWLLIPVGISFVVYYLLKGYSFYLNPWAGYALGSIGSSAVTSNLLSFLLPFSGINKNVLIYSVTVGSLGGFLGSVEGIWLQRRGRSTIDLKLMLKIYVIFFIIAFLILFIGGHYG